MVVGFVGAFKTFCHKVEVGSKQIYVRNKKAFPASFIKIGRTNLP